MFALSFLWCLSETSTLAFGQSIYQKIALPTGNGQQIQAVATAPDGRLWVFAKQPQPGQTASVMMQSSLGGNAFQTVTATVPSQYGFQTKGIYGSRVRTDSFFPQNGTTSSFGPGDIPSTGGANFQDFEWQASPNSFSQVCKDYTVDKTGKSPVIRSGPWPALDGMYYIGGDGKSSTLYSRTIGANGVCDLTTRDASTIPVIQAWKQADGKFLVERVVHADPINWATTEVGLLANGVMTMLVSPNADTHPKFSATRCCTLIHDIGNQQDLVSYQDSKGVHAFLFHAGQTQSVYDAGASNIRALALNGKWAVVGVSTSTDWSVDQMREIDTTTGQKWLVVDKNDPYLVALLGYTPVTLGFAMVTPEGTVYSPVTSLTNVLTFVQSIIPGVTGFLKPTATLTASSTSIVVGDPVTLTWNTTGATEDGGIYIDNGVGFVLASGSRVLYLSETTTFFLSAIGPGGAALVSVTVNVTPKVILPMISDGGVRNAASLENVLAPGTLASVFGTDFTYSAAASSIDLPLPITLSGVQVLVNGVSVPLTYASGKQTNFLVPIDVKLGAGTVQTVRDGIRSNIVAVTITATAPGIFQYGDFGILTDSQNRLITADNPSIPGDVNVIWLTGLGAVDGCPNLKTGEASGTICYAHIQPTLIVDGLPTHILYAGIQPQFPGLYQINFLVPGQVGTVPSAREVLAVLVAGDMQTTFKMMSQAVQ
jgi:uncharacterized protein (TIGR03437 family)